MNLSRRRHAGVTPRQSGGIGRHATFRALCAYARGGSSPPFGTIRKGRIVGLVRRFAKPLRRVSASVGSNPTPSANIPLGLRCEPRSRSYGHLGSTYLFLSCDAICDVCAGRAAGLCIPPAPTHEALTKRELRPWLGLEIATWSFCFNSLAFVQTTL